MEDRNQLITKAGKIAFEYEQQYGGCSQCTLAAVKNTVGNISDDVIKAATGLAGGIGLTGTTCGAVTGGVMALSMWKGRDYCDFRDLQNNRPKSLAIARKLCHKFEIEYGSTICKDIQTKLLGRSYDLCDEQQKEQFLAAGGREEKCSSVCANAARWVVEILLEEKLL